MPRQTHARPVPATRRRGRARGGRRRRGAGRGDSGRRPPRRATTSASCSGRATAELVAIACWDRRARPASRSIARADRWVHAMRRADTGHLAALAAVLGEEAPTEADFARACCRKRAFRRRARVARARPRRSRTTSSACISRGVAAGDRPGHPAAARPAARERHPAPRRAARSARAVERVRRPARPARPRAGRHGSTASSVSAPQTTW